MAYRGKTFLGCRIVPDLCNKIDIAKQEGVSKTFFDFAMAKSRSGIKGWVNYFREKDIPFIVVTAGNHYVLLKRKFVFSREKNDHFLKKCKCNPLVKAEACDKCRPTYVEHVRKTEANKCKQAKS